MSNLDVINAFITQSPRDAKANSLRYDAYLRSIYSYRYLIGYWIHVPNKNDSYAVIRAHGAPTKTTWEHISTLHMRSGPIRATTIPILTPELFDELPECQGEQGWDRSYFALYRDYAAKAARTKTQFYFDHWKRRMAEVTENLDKIAAVFGWSYDRSIYTVENALADNPKLFERFVLLDMGVLD